MSDPKQLENKEGTLLKHCRNFLKFNKSTNKNTECRLGRTAKNNFGSCALNDTDSGFTQEDLQPPIEGWRRANTQDKSAIRKLQILSGGIANVLYRKKNIEDLIEKCYFPIVQFDSRGDLVSFTAYDSYPNIPSVPLVWMDWLNINYRIEGICARNVLFIHYMVWQPTQANQFLFLLLKTVFSEFINLQFIIIVKPPKVDVPDLYSNYFIPVLPYGLEDLEVDSLQLLLMCLRSTVIEPLPIRSAFEIEYENILSIIFGNNHKWKSMWDLSNIIYHKNTKTLICEFENEIAGIMILSQDPNVEVLCERFVLEPFMGLRRRKYTDSTFIIPPPSRDISRTRKPSTFLQSSEYLFSQMNLEMKSGRLRPVDSSLLDNISKSTLASSREFSASSLIKASSLLDLNKHNVSMEASIGKIHSRKRTDLSLLIEASKTLSRISSTKYHGYSNAFVINFFAVDCSKLIEKLSLLDFLKVAFNTNPDKEYCIILIPTDFLTFPLLDFFIRVTPRFNSNFKEELYLCHKNSLSVKTMFVKKTKKTDLILLNTFLKDVHEGDAIYEDIMLNCFEKTKNYMSFILTTGESIVGVSLIRIQEQTEEYKLYYEFPDLSSHQSYDSENFSVIKYLVITPEYHNHVRFFVRDIMKRMNVSCIYYAHHKNNKDRTSLVTILGEFAAIKPRKRIGFNKIRLNSKKIFPENVSNFQGLFFLNPLLCGVHKIHLNIVIVVVGASRTAISFVEHLIFGPESYFYHYSNIIWVSPHGLDIKENEQSYINLMFPIQDDLTKNYFSLLSLESYVTFVFGIMTEINRSKKYIVVNNKLVVPYDYLILTCGLQYFVPTPELKEIHKLCQRNFKSPLAKYLLYTTERRKPLVRNRINNLFIINTKIDAEKAFQALQLLIEKTTKDEKKIIVYGHDLQVFLTINALLKFGVPGERIVFIEPFPSDSVSVTLFNDSSIDEAVIDLVKECKVKYYTGYHLFDWSISSDEYITALKFHSKRHQLILPCLAFFPYVEKMVSDVTFNACNDAGLVYDGKLVIDHNFRTNDDSIYAAGSFTKYSRRYFAPDMNHQYFNSREVGGKLAEIIGGKINPLLKDVRRRWSDLVPELKLPVVLYCQMPGGYNLFLMRKPGKAVDLETAYNFNDYGEVLTTGDCQMSQGLGYFRLHLNSEGFVESITCFTKNDVDYENLSSLYGLHESLLNNLLFRYDLALIQDFFEYFREPWALAIYHENFHLLKDCNHKEFLKKVSENETLYDKVIQALRLNNWRTLSKPTFSHLQSEYVESAIDEKIRKNVYEFVEHHERDLPVYATSSKIKFLLKKH